MEEPTAKQLQMRALGSKGGKATVAKHGKEHMSQIGQVGFTRAMERFAANPYVLNKFLAKNKKWSKLP